MLLSAVLHIGDLRFTALTDADTAFPSDLQLLERGQCPSHNQGHISTLWGDGMGWEGWVHHTLILFTSCSFLSLSVFEFCLTVCQHLLPSRKSTFSAFLAKKEPQHREITHTHTHTLSRYWDPCFLSVCLALSLCNHCDPWPLWDGKQMTSMLELVRVCHCHGSWCQQRDLGCYHLILLFVYWLCPEIQWWLIISRSTSRLCYFYVFILSCHCNLSCLYPSHSVLLPLPSCWNVAGVLQWLKHRPHLWHSVLQRYQLTSFHHHLAHLVLLLQRQT